MSFDPCVGCGRRAPLYGATTCAECGAAETGLSVEVLSDLADQRFAADFSAEPEEGEQ